MGLGVLELEGFHSFIHSIIYSMARCCSFGWEHRNERAKVAVALREVFFQKGRHLIHM